MQKEIIGHPAISRINKDVMLCSLYGNEEALEKDEIKNIINKIKELKK